MLKNGKNDKKCHFFWKTLKNIVFFNCSLQLLRKNDEKALTMSLMTVSLSYPFGFHGFLTEAHDT